MLVLHVALTCTLQVICMDSFIFFDRQIRICICLTYKKRVCICLNLFLYLHFAGYMLEFFYFFLTVK